MTAIETILPWLDRLGRSASAQALRADLAGRWPALDPSRLKRLAIVGAAGEGIRLASLCAAHGIEVAAVADDDPARRGMAVGTRIVQPVETLGGLDRATPVVI